VRSGHTGGIFLTVPEVDSLARTFEGILARKGAVMSDLIEAFSALAATAVGVATRNATPEDLEKLEAIVQREQDSHTLESERRLEFHTALWDTTHNLTLTLVMKQMQSVHHFAYDHVAHDIDLSTRESEVAEAVVRDHRAILRAMRRGDAERASTVASLHHAFLKDGLRELGIDVDSATITDTWPASQRSSSMRIFKSTEVY
jgi:DNA-binding FadR family transcriptional regulator